MSTSTWDQEVCYPFADYVESILPDETTLDSDCTQPDFLKSANEVDWHSLCIQTPDEPSILLEVEDSEVHVRKVDFPYVDLLDASDVSFKLSGPLLIYELQRILLAEHCVPDILECIVNMTTDFFREPGDLRKIARELEQFLGAQVFNYIRFACALLN